MKTNEALQKDVQEAIKWEPLLHAAQIGVIAENGIITLTGTVESYPKKLEAENAAKNTAGVKVVIEKIEIKTEYPLNKSDNEIAKEVLNDFKLSWGFPKDKIKVEVENGCVTLSGELQWNSEREAAKKSVSSIFGVKGITNDIKIKFDANNEIEKKDIERAIARNWSVKDLGIEVQVSGNEVKLIGTVNSWYQKHQAERIAWNAPGVLIVDNELIIEFEHA